MLNEESTAPARVTVQIGLDELIAAACALPPEARRRLRRALDERTDERHAWLAGPLAGETDAVLAELWDNDDDGIYDDL